MLAKESTDGSVPSLAPGHLQEVYSVGSGSDSMSSATESKMSKVEWGEGDSVVNGHRGNGEAVLPNTQGGEQATFR